MAKREYDSVDCGSIHVASLWYVRQVNLVGPLMKTDYLCGDAHSRLGQALQAQWTLRALLHGGPAYADPLSQKRPGRRGLKSVTANPVSSFS